MEQNFQNSTKSNNDQNNDNWHKSAILHECGKKGNIRPKFTKTKSAKDDEKKVPTSKRRRHAKNQSEKKKKHNKCFQFVQDMDKYASDDNDHVFPQFGFLNQILET